MVPSGPIRPRLGGEGGGQRSTCLENDNDNDRIGMGMGTGMSFGVWSPVLRRAARLLRGRVLSAFGFGSFSRIVHGRRTACDSANQRTLVRKLALAALALALALAPQTHLPLTALGYAESSTLCLYLEIGQTRQSRTASNQLSSRQGLSQCKGLDVFWDRRPDRKEKSERGTGRPFKVV